MSPPKIIYVDIEKCEGCMSCYYACAVEHSVGKNRYTAFLETPRPYSRIRVIGANGYSVPIRCMHCEKPACLEVCPVRAITKTPEGVVLVNEAKCIGCKECLIACPYGAMFLNPQLGVAAKCDFCVDRAKRGLKPACVEACPTGALIYGDLEVVLRSVHGEVAKELVLGIRGPASRGLVVYGSPRG